MEGEVTDNELDLGQWRREEGFERHWEGEGD